MDATARRRRLLMTVWAGGSVTYASYITSLNPLLRLRYNELAGTTVINYGSLGHAQDSTWTPGAGALGQTGQFGVNEAYSFDKLTSVVTVPTTPLLHPSTFTFAALVNATSAGELNQGVFFDDSSATRTFLINSASLPLRCFIAGGVFADTITTNNFISLAAWHFIFCTFDNAGDRKVHIYKGIAGAVTEAAYGTQIAMTGTISAAAGNVLLGNRSANNGTWDGLQDESLLFDYVLTPAQMLQLTTLAGLT